MAAQIVKSITQITHDVWQFTTEKPDGYVFKPGQATHISINKPGWEDAERPFTFTCLPENANLEFIIKTYPLKNGVTNQLLALKVDDQLILHDVFGTINYKYEGVFIAGGAGVTPFIAILRCLKSKNEIGGNKLIFANKTNADIILKAEFTKLLGSNFINILSDDKVEGCSNGLITVDFLREHIDNTKKIFYLCGPPEMIASIEAQLLQIGVSANSIVKEKF